MSAGADGRDENKNALRILFVSGFFPPNAPVGAVRPDRLEQHWRRLGHDVRTIAIALPARHHSDQTPRPGVDYIPYSPPRDLVANVIHAVRRSGTGKTGKTDHADRVAVLPKPKGIEVPDLQASRLSWHMWLKTVYQDMLFFPDRYRSWIRPAVRRGLAIGANWSPHLIYSSGPPHCGHIVAAHIAARRRLPWIAELRDLWANNPYEDKHAIVRWMNNRLARRTLAKAAGCVVVTAMAKTQMERIARGPVIVAYNGYDPEDFAGLDDVSPFDRERLSILHAGVIYAGKRDPTPLFKAINALGERSREVRCLFYHDSRGSVASLVSRHGLEHCVEIRPPIAHREMLRLERQVDILLECHWNDPKGDGVIPGKLFEYIGARRPVLSIGSTTAEAAEVVRENRLGLISNDPDEIRAMLLRALETKRHLGRLHDLPDRGLATYWRTTQYRKIDALIAGTLTT